MKKIDLSITEWSGLAGTSVGHPVQPPCRSRVTYSRLQLCLPQNFFLNNILFIFTSDDHATKFKTQFMLLHPTAFISLLSSL